MPGDKCVKILQKMRKYLHSHPIISFTLWKKFLFETPRVYYREFTVLLKTSAKKEHKVIKSQILKYFS